jgi:hypothetical protein
VIEDYKQSDQKTIGDARRKIDNGLPPFFEGMLAAHVDSDVIDRWIRWRSARRLRTSPDRETLQPASINRELSLAHHMMRKRWEDACVRAGVPGLLFHDLRRSGVRNLRRAGVSQKVAREFSGQRKDWSLIQTSPDLYSSGILNSRRAM